jgi:hypothetical protein
MHQSPNLLTTKFSSPWLSMVADGAILKEKQELTRTARLRWPSAELDLVPGRGLEPPRCYSLVPETSASTNSATRAGEEGRAMYARGRELSIERA